jgi:hypothetical protein
VVVMMMMMMMQKKIANSRFPHRSENRLRILEAVG